MSATANVLNKAQSLGKPASPLDGWNRTWAEAQKRLDHYDPNAPHPVVQSTEDLGKAVTGDWHSSTKAGVEKGMAQQTKELGKQLQSLNPFSDAKAPPGILGKVGAAFGLLTTAEQIISMPLAMIPSPALPAVRVLDFDVGLPHAHPHPPNTPPAPPIPLPSTGPVIPIPILSGANTVLINGMPAARCGDMGLGIWCGGYFPFYEIFLGSSTVWVEGARAARLAVDVTKHCTFSNPKPVNPADAPIGPMFGFTVTASSDVMIGGLPMPSLSAKAMGAMFKGLFKMMGKVFGKLKGLLGKGKALNFGELPNVRGPARKGSGVSQRGPWINVGHANFMTPTAFRESIDFLKEMKKAGSLFVRGDDAFVKAAERDLHVIASSPTGRKVLQEIRDSGQKVVVNQGGPNCTPFHSSMGAGGVKTGSTVKYNPADWYGPKTPPDVVLMHELGHARNAATGTSGIHQRFANAADNPQWSNLEEWKAVNQAENPYRGDRGLPARTGYDDFP